MHCQLRDCLICLKEHCWCQLRDCTICLIELYMTAFRRIALLIWKSKRIIHNSDGSVRCQVMLSRSWQIICNVQCIASQEIVCLAFALYFWKSKQIHNSDGIGTSKAGRFSPWPLVVIWHPGPVRVGMRYRCPSAPAHFSSCASNWCYLTVYNSLAMYRSRIFAEPIGRGTRFCLKEYAIAIFYVIT